MPNGNHKGPVGNGPKTGRRAGFCAGFDGPGYQNGGPRSDAGMDMGRGFAGRGRRNRFCAPTGFGQGRGMGTGYGRFTGPGGNEFTQDTERDRLRRQAATLKSRLDQVNRRLNEWNDPEEPAGQK